MNAVTLAPLALAGHAPARRSTPPSPWRLIEGAKSWEALPNANWQIEIDAADENAAAYLASIGMTSNDLHRWTGPSNTVWSLLPSLFANNFRVAVDGHDIDKITRDIESFADQIHQRHQTVTTVPFAIDCRDLDTALDVTETRVLSDGFRWASAPKVVNGVVFIDVTVGRVRSRRPEPGERGWNTNRSATTLVYPAQDWKHGEAVHRITWTGTSLHFHDHPGVIDDPDGRALDALAGEVGCGCRTVLAAWRAGEDPHRLVGYSVDARFAGAWGNRNEATRNRAEAAESAAVDPLTLGTLNRAAIRTRRMALRAARNPYGYRCAPRLYLDTADELFLNPDHDRHSRLHDDRDMRVIVDVTADEVPTVECAGAGSPLLFRVHPFWWASHVDTVGNILGVLICKVLEWDDNGMPVRFIAGRPGPGLTIYPAEATVTWDPDAWGQPATDMKWQRS